MKYFLSFEPEGMCLLEYDEQNGVRAVGHSVLIYHGTLSVSELFDTAEEAIKSLGGYSKPVKMPDGAMVIPQDANFPTSSPLKRWTPGVRETWPGEDER